MNENQSVRPHASCSRASPLALRTGMLAALVALSACASEADKAADSGAASEEAVHAGSDSGPGADDDAESDDAGSSGGGAADAASGPASSGGEDPDASAHGDAGSTPRDAGANTRDAGGSASKDAGTSGSKGTSCDRRTLLCRKAEPVCPAQHVASIVDNCFGPCVAIDQCACSEADACPQPEQYTCHRSAMHCGPYVN
jgi:hypothetical protein